MDLLLSAFQEEISGDVGRCAEEDSPLHQSPLLEPDAALNPPSATSPPPLETDREGTSDI